MEKKLHGQKSGLSSSVDFNQIRSPAGTGVSSTAPNRNSGGIHYNKLNQPIPKDKQFKVICVGDSMVGKTSLIQRFIENTFKDHNTLPTLSTDFRVKNIQLGEGDPRT